MCCPYGEPILFRYGLCEPCYHRRRGRARFTGRREEVLSRDRRLCCVCQASTPLVDLVLDSLASPHSRRAYYRALENSFTWYPSNAHGSGFTQATLQRYRSHLAQRNLTAASITLHFAAPNGRSHPTRAVCRPQRFPDRQLADLAAGPAAPGRVCTVPMPSRPGGRERAGENTLQGRTGDYYLVRCPRLETVAATLPTGRFF